MKHPARLLCIMVLLTFLFTSCQGRQSTAATEGRRNTVAGRQLAAASPVNKLGDNALVLFAGSPTALINHAKVPIDPENPKVRPFSWDAVVFAPVRFVAESLGGKVTWDQVSKTATVAADSKTIKLSPDSRIMYVDATPIELDFPIMGENGRILVPVNQFAEAMGWQVFYDRGLIVISKVKNLLDKTADKVFIDDLIADISRPPSVETADGLRDLLGKIRESVLDSSFGNPYFYKDETMINAARAADGGAGAANKTAAFEEESFAITPEYSRTNVQVQGVDEADTVKSDGKYIYQVKKGSVAITEAYPSSELKVAGTILFDDSYFSPVELYIEKDILTVIGQSTATVVKKNGIGTEEMKKRYPDYEPQSIKAIVYDCKEKNNILKLRELELEGNYVSSRKIGSTLYLLADKDIRVCILDPDTGAVYFDGDTASAEAMGYDPKAVAEAVEISVKPLYRDTSVAGEYKAVDYADIYYFPDSMELSYLTIASMDLDKPEEKAEVAAYLGSGQEVYVSPDNMYVAFTDYDGYRTMKKGGFLPADAGYSTVVYRFALDGGTAAYRNKGVVPGTILNQFSMDEYGGTFRIATTKGVAGRSGERTSANNVYILDEAMGISGRLENIAPGEKIYSVRFMGDRGYVVTFRTVDPLFVIDLSQAASPKVLGALKIPGYSDYLHPYDRDHILGFGKDTVEIKGQAYYQGMKIALFDVSDVANPKQKFTVNIGDRGTDSELLRNHKALLFSYDKNLLSFPVSVYEVDMQGKGGGNEEDKLQYGRFSFQGAYVYSINLTEGFSLKGRITHLAEDDYLKAGDHWYNSDFNVERILYIGDTLYTLSNNMIKANALSDLKETGSLRLP